MWTPRDHAAIKYLRDFRPDRIPNNLPDSSGSIQEGASVPLPALIETMFTHPLHGNIRVVAVLVHADTPEPDGITHRLGHFERMRSYQSRQSSRALFLHQIIFVEPLSSPLVLWCGEWFSSFNTSAKALGNHQQGGWVAWHLLKYTQLTMAVVMKEIGFLNHGLLANERVPLSQPGQPEDQPPSSFSLRDAMATQCHFECDEWNCQIPNKQECSLNLNTPKRVELFAKGFYPCPKNNGEHSFTPSRRDGDYATQGTCNANNLTYRPPVLKPRPIPDELKLSAPEKGSTKAEKSQYQNACFSAQYQYTPSSTADFTEAPSALRLAIEFEAVRGMGTAAYCACLRYFQSTNTFTKVMLTTPGLFFAYASRLIAAPHELHELLQTWEFVRSQRYRSDKQPLATPYLQLSLRLKQYPESLPHIIRNKGGIQAFRLSLDVYEEVCRFYVAANSLSPSQLAEMIGMPMIPAVATVMAFAASAPMLPSVTPLVTAAASSRPTIEDVSDEPAAGISSDQSGSSATVD